MFLRPIALAGALLLATHVVGAQQRPALSPHQQLAREIYKELVEINTTDDSSGSNTKAAEAMAARFRAAGFSAGDVQVIVPPGRPTKGNLVVRYRGRAGSTVKPILLLAHIDVVGLSFGGGKFFHNGLGIVPGTGSGSFRLLSYTTE